MITAGIRAFMSRDWAAVRRAKDEYWSARIARLGPYEGLRIADELRRQMREQHPDWPRPDERAQDLLAHVRLAALLRRAGSTCRR